MYDLEQWRDFLRLKNKLPIESPRRRNATRKLPQSAPRPRGSGRAINTATATPPPKPPPPPGLPSHIAEYQRVVSMLVEMGFLDIPTVQAVVVACKGDLDQCITLLTQSPPQRNGHPSRGRSATNPHLRSDQKSRPPPRPNVRQSRRSWAGPGSDSTLIVRCGHCRTSNRIPRSTRTFVCGVCRGKNNITIQRQCPACGCKLK